jgi:hypothetical protein
VPAQREQEADRYYSITFPSPHTMPTKLLRLATYLVAFMSVGCANLAHAEKPTSIYTALEGPACKLVADDSETGDRTNKCPGIAGYSVLVQESDDRASLTIITPDNRGFPLDFWDFAIPGFSTLRQQLEWRQTKQGTKRRPIGFIVQVDTVNQENPAAPKPLSFFLVARVTENSACLTAKIPADQLDARLSALQAADDPKRHCLSST